MNTLPPAVRDLLSQAWLYLDSGTGELLLVIIGLAAAALLLVRIRQQRQGERRPPVAAPAAPVAAAEEAPAAALSSRLARTRSGLRGRLRGIFSGGPRLDREMLDQVEETLIASDMGVRLATGLSEQVQQELERGQEMTAEELLRRLKAKVLEILARGGDGTAPIPSRRRGDGPAVVMVVGVNGTGKTTTVAKLAHHASMAGAKVLMVAADTFRAAAVEQLATWGRRLEVPVVTGAENAKPATVVFEGMKRGMEEGVDLVLIDTAGRLHTRANLMQELGGMRNAIARHMPSAPHETLLVLDGSTGQNALAQAREFNAAVPLTGLVITKLDGTPKGGIVVAIKDELGIPVRYIGVGETPEDLRLFIPEDFTAALFDEEAAESVREAA